MTASRHSYVRVAIDPPPSPHHSGGRATPITRQDKQDTLQQISRLECVRKKRTISFSCTARTVTVLRALARLFAHALLVRIGNTRILQVWTLGTHTRVVAESFPIAALSPLSPHADWTAPVFGAVATVTWGSERPPAGGKLFLLPQQTCVRAAGWCEHMADRQASVLSWHPLGWDCQSSVRTLARWKHQILRAWSMEGGGTEGGM